ncbi:MAG: TolC family protein [Candidatus Omnitrophica bacterium]|nr:TolC family protein [Candidatus Omnitrophota bacterium]
MRIVRALLVLVIAGALLAPLVRAQEGPLTLADCYRLALARSEAIGIQKELILETEGLMLQSLSTALPKVAFAYSEKWQDVYKGDSFHSNVPEAKFTLSQPLFTGFKEFAAIRASRHIGKQRAAELKRAEQLLLVDVSDAFYLCLSLQEDEEALKDIIKALKDRFTEMQKRQGIGKSRKSEVVNVEARLRRAEAGLAMTMVQKEASGALLEFLIGREPEALLDDVLPQEARTLEAMAQELESRADIAAAREALAAYKQNVTAARSQFFPTATLSGNSYTTRVGTSAGNDWDVTLGVSVPIFNGLSDVGAVKQARAQKNQASLRLDQARRKAKMELRTAFRKWTLYEKRLTGLERALEAVRENYVLQSEDFQKNLVSNLDVLQAIEDLQAVRREKAVAKADARRAFWALKIAVGGVEL